MEEFCIQGTQTGRLRSPARPTHPQGEKISECVDDVVTLLSGPNSVKTLQNRDDELTFPKMLDALNRLSDLAYLFGWERLAESIFTVYSDHKSDFDVGRGDVPRPRRPILRAIREQEEWMIQCGETLAGYLSKYGDGEPGDEGVYGDGGRKIYAADLAYLNRLRAEADLEPIPER